jgi:Domain of unknown function (DUF4157)
MKLPDGVKLKVNSWIAGIAARKMKVGSVALVLGKTIHLYNITPHQFHSSPRLLRHELKHVEQYRRLGFFRFLVLYAWYSLKYGYHNNPLEVEARAAESPQPPEVG